MDRNFTSFSCCGVEKILLLFISTLLLFSFAACDTVREDKFLFPQIKTFDLKSLKIADKNNKVLDFTRKMCVWTLGKDFLPTNELRVTKLAEQIIGLTYLKGGVKYFV